MAHQLEKEAEEYVRQYVNTHPNDKLVYHNLAHIETVAAVAKKIGRHAGLSEREQELLQVAAWFHDLGYWLDPLNHHTAGADLVSGFLRGKGVPEREIHAVTAAILSTRLPQSPATALEEALCDGDLSYFGASDFFDRNKLLRTETALLNGRKPAKEAWLKATAALLEGHRFRTDYAKAHLGEMKERNLRKLKKKLAEAQPPENPLTALLQTQAVQSAAAPAKDLKKESKAERTIETMFRITSANSQRLSDQADTKAHIMISVNSIIISVLLSMVVRHINEHAELTVPVVMLLLVNLLTIVFSILATRPNIPRGVFTQQEVQEKKVNLLFFGNFYRMNFEDYFKGMEQVMDDHGLLKLSLLRDIYGQGVVLGRKYRLLKLAYNVFMFGLIVSVIAFFLVARY